MFDPIFIFVLVAIVEVLFSATWNSTYFRIGIPIYSKQYPYIGTAPDPINDTILNKAFKKTFTHSLVFKQIENGEYAFREKLFQFTLFTYTPIMHGNLNIDKSSRNIRVTGHINWWILAFIVTWFIFFSEDLFIFPFLFLFLGVIYLFQKNKYDKVAKFAYEWNSRNWPRPSSN